MTTTPILIGHRGYPSQYPENSLIGISAALAAGAQAIEFDIQLTADRVPVLFHDESLTRVLGCPGNIMETPLDQVCLFSSGEQARFGNTFSSIRIATLAETVNLFMQHPKVDLFVELKQTSLEHFSIESMVDIVLKQLEPVKTQSIIISFNENAIRYAQHAGRLRTGWILKHYNDAAKETATSLQPDFIICNYQKIPDHDGALWPDTGSWALYEISDAEMALKWHRRGASYIETDTIGEMLMQITK